MALCNLTQRIPSNQCIGDSLRTINANFSALEIGICTLPTLVEGEGLDLDLKITPQTSQTYIEISPSRFPTFLKDFDSTSNVVEKTTLTLKDETSIQTYKFPYNPLTQQTKPIGAFTAISEQTGYPKLTLFWTASSTDFLSTVYSLNSAVAFNSIPLTEPNDEVFCFHQEGDTLYVGGAFDQVGGVAKYKLLTISLSSGSTAGPILGRTGAPADERLPSLFPVITKGNIKCITKTTVGSSKFLIVGGDFITEDHGRGLLIYNETTNSAMGPFYFNGEVNEVLVDADDNALYAVGQFDWVNIGSQPATEASNERIVCNNLAKLNLNLLNSVNAFDLEYLSNSSLALRSSVKLNTITRLLNVIFIGGELQISSSEGLILHKNLLSLRRLNDATTGLPKGSVISSNRFIFDKPIYTMLIDNSILYIGGQFTIAAAYDDFYNPNLENRESVITCYHAVCINLTNIAIPFFNKIWKPRFNDIIYKLETANQLYDSEIYALGAFTEVNDKAVGHLAAVTKATSLLGDTPRGLHVPWNIYLSTGISKKTNALLRDGNSVYVGGTFSEINGETRKFYGKVAGAKQTSSEISPKTIEFEFGGHIVTQGHPLELDFSINEKAIARDYSGPYGIVNKTVFPKLTQTFRGLRPNQLCRFYLKRNGSNDLLQTDVYILGWTLTYEKNNVN